MTFSPARGSSSKGKFKTYFKLIASQLLQVSGGEKEQRSKRGWWEVTWESISASIGFIESLAPLACRCCRGGKRKGRRDGQGQPTTHWSASQSRLALEWGRQCFRQLNPDERHFASWPDGRQPRRQRRDGPLLLALGPHDGIKKKKKKKKKKLGRSSQDRWWCGRSFVRDSDWPISVTATPAHSRDTTKDAASQSLGN